MAAWGVGRGPTIYVMSACLNISQASAFYILAGVERAHVMCNHLAGWSLSRQSCLAPATLRRGWSEQWGCCCRCRAPVLAAAGALASRIGAPLQGPPPAQQHPRGASLQVAASEGHARGAAEAAHGAAVQYAVTAVEETDVDDWIWRSYSQITHVSMRDEEDEPGGIALLASPPPDPPPCHP
jgi:hypothetical protein